MLTRRAAWAVALAATLTMTVSYIDRATLAVLAPSVTAALGISDTEYGWLTSAFSIAYLVATPFAGWWIDRVGARRGLVGSVLAWSTVAALHAVVPGFGVLFALRIALGITEGPSFPGAAQTVQRVLPPDDRARGFGVLFTGSSIGAMLVPPLASWLYGVAGWRVAFLGTAAIGLVWVPLWLWVTGRPAARAQLDTPPPAAAGDVARASFAELVRHPVVVRALLGILAAAPAIGFMMAWGAKYLERAFGTAQGEVGHYLWLPPLALDAGAIAFGDLASRRRRRAAARVAPGAAPPPERALYGIALVLCATIVALPYAATAWQGTAIVALSMAGGGALYTIATADLLARVPPANVSLAGGIMAGAQSLALIIANPLIGMSVTRAGDYDDVAIALGIWVIPGSLAWILWTPPPAFAARRP